MIIFLSEPMFFYGTNACFHTGLTDNLSEVLIKFSLLTRVYACVGARGLASFASLQVSCRGTYLLVQPDGQSNLFTIFKSIKPKLLSAINKIDRFCFLL